MLTDDEMAAIKARRDDPLVLVALSDETLDRIHNAWDDRKVLLAEVERLRASETALRILVSALASEGDFDQASDEVRASVHAILYLHPNR